MEGRVGGQRNDHDLPRGQPVGGQQVAPGGLGDGDHADGCPKRQGCGPAKEQPGSARDALREEEWDQVVHREQGPPSGPVGHQVVGTVVESGPHAAQEAGDDPLLARGEGGDRHIHYLQPLSSQRCPLPGRPAGGVAQNQQSLVAAQERPHRSGQVEHVATDAGEVVGGGAGVEGVAGHISHVSLPRCHPLEARRSSKTAATPALIRCAVKYLSTLSRPARPIASRRAGSRSRVTMA